MLNYLKYLLYIIGSTIGGIIIFTIFNYFGIISSDIFKILKIIIVISSTFISAYLLGAKSKNKGYLEGLKLGGLLIFILLLLNLIFGTFKFPVLLYYLIILVTSILGSMVGINLKRNNS